MYSRIVCKNDCFIQVLISDRFEEFHAGEVFGYNLRKRIIDENGQLTLIFSIQELNHERSYTYDYIMPESEFKKNFMLDEGATLPLKKYLYRIR